MTVFGAHFAGQNYWKTKDNLFRRIVCRCHYPQKAYISSAGEIRQKPSPRRPRRPWGNRTREEERKYWFNQSDGTGVDQRHAPSARNDYKPIESF